MEPPNFVGGIHLRSQPIANATPHQKGGSMARRIMTVKRFEEIQRLIAEGKSDRFISRAVGCRRSKVSRIRNGADRVQDVGKTPAAAAPVWASQVDWESVILELGQGHE